MTEILFRVVERLPDWRIGSLPEMKFFAERRHEESLRMSVRCPPNIRIRPAFFSYYDLFFTEDFPALRRGATRLCSDYRGRSQPFISLPESDFEELFRSWSRQSAGGAWKRVGHFPLDNRDDLFCIKSLSMDLILISPVCVMLQVSAFPRDAYVRRFRELISRDIQHTAIVHRFGVFSKKWHSGGVLPSIARQHELEELFLKLNREVVVILREYVGRGWSAKGPLPSFHVFALDQCDEEAEGQSQHSEFWRSLSLTRTPEMTYSDGQGLNIVPPYWVDKGTFTAPYRCLVDTQRYLTEDRTKGYATLDYALYHNMEDDVLRPLLPFLALREAGQRTIDKLGCIRDRVSPYIVTQVGFKARLRAAFSLLFVPLRLNSLQFESARTKESSVRRGLETPPSLPFTRKTHSKKDDGKLVADLVFQIRSLSDHVSEHLDLIRTAYHDLWNFTIQWILIILTVAATVIAVVQVVPKNQPHEKPQKNALEAEQSRGHVRR